MATVKRKNNCIALMFFVICLCSCTGKIDKANSLIIDVDAAKAIALEPYDLFDKTVSYIPLRCPEDIPIGKIEKVYCLNDGQFMVYDSQSDQILLFGADGSFHTKVGHKGHASNEYTEWNDCCYDSESDCILAFDRAPKRLHVYDTQGQLKSTILSKRHFSSIICKEGYLWGYSNFKIANPKNCQLTKADMNLKTLSSFFPINEFVGSTLKPTFSVAPDGNTYFWYPNDNTVYILNDAPVPFLTVRFGSRTLPYDRILKADYETYDLICNEKNYLGFIDNFVVSQDICRFDIIEYCCPIKNSGH